MVFESDIQPGCITPRREAYVAERIGKLLLERQRPGLSPEILEMNLHELPVLQLELAGLQAHLHARHREAA